MKIKVCGIKQRINEVASCLPDYMGFIFYEKSPRNFSGSITALPSTIQKVGVFVDASVEKVIHTATTHNLQIIQLHGNESPNYCKELRQQELPLQLELWKVFSVGDTFNFDVLTPYEAVIDKFLFDTSGVHKGGNGVTFNWQLLEQYPSAKPFILSGGIGLEEMEAVQDMASKNPLLHAVDVNSKLEDAPGLKNIDRLQQLMKKNA